MSSVVSAWSGNWIDFGVPDSSHTCNLVSSVGQNHLQIHKFVELKSWLKYLSNHHTELFLILFFLMVFPEMSLSCQLSANFMSETEFFLRPVGKLDDSE